MTLRKYVFLIFSFSLLFFLKNTFPSQQYNIIDQFEHIEGNAFVGQLCKEQCAIINQAGQLFETLQQSPHYIKAPRLFDLLQTPKEKLANVIQSSEQFADCFITLIIETLVLANHAIRTTNLIQAVKLNDFAQAIIEYLEQIITINKQCSIGFLIDDSKNATVNLYQLGADICPQKDGIAIEATKHPDKALECQINKLQELEKAFSQLIGDSIAHSGRSRKKAESYMQCNYYDQVSEILEEDAKNLAAQQPLPESVRMEMALFSEEIINSEIRVLIGKACRLARIGNIRAKKLLKHSSDSKLVMRTPEGQFVKTTKNAFKKTKNSRQYKKFSR